MSSPSEGRRANPLHERASREAERYRALGYNPMPSRTDIKGPMLSAFAEYWEQPLPDSVFRDWATPNIQIMTGVRWKLAVVDCDGDQSIRVWREMCDHFGMPEPTWISRTGTGGQHWYFSLPGWLDECPSRRLWGVWDTWLGPKRTGDWRKHEEVRLLGDRALVIAPPSIHVKTGVEYRWLPTLGPDEIARPAKAPSWLIRMPAIINPETVEKLAVPRFEPVEKRPGTSSASFHPRDDVIAAIPDKVALARSWGLRIASRKANSSGWLNCHAIDREDNNPSASFHGEAGVYSERHTGTSLSLFDLAVRLGAYANWEEAKSDLGQRFLGPPGARPRSSS